MHVPRDLGVLKALHSFDTSLVQENQNLRDRLAVYEEHLSSLREENQLLKGKVVIVSDGHSSPTPNTSCASASVDLTAVTPGASNSEPNEDVQSNDQVPLASERPVLPAIPCNRAEVFLRLSPPLKTMRQKSSQSVSPERQPTKAKKRSPRTQPSLSLDERRQTSTSNPHRQKPYLHPDGIHKRDDHPSDSTYARSLGERRTCPKLHPDLNAQSQSSALAGQMEGMH